MKTEEKLTLVDIPFQIENLIQNMMNKNERVHIRGNYRVRLQSIRDTIDKSLKQYDNEMFMAPMNRRTKR